MLDAVIISPVAPISGISRPAVISAAEPLALALLEGSGQPALQVDGTIVRQMQPGETLEVRLRPRARLVVRLDPERYQRHSDIRLSLLDLPFLPDEMRDLLPGGDPVALTLDRYLRSDLKAARSSSLKSRGCSQAAKWPPRSSLL
jgi:NAD+ kinase